ncbi:hypothetical protein NLG97_g632 [Lecanicillium saksenae]|uniref:Uncharacterized protein n=1 Tax=Lecanicillium saksenae TaxID=468837 RepID=A0ACC1R618_9HYPO|nr:hypothetical protein NLG97_g632 [Lecanicillium saksenae]
MISNTFVNDAVQGHWLLTLLGLATVSAIGVVVYRLTLHPLARVPGPVLAAATGAYEAYFQLFKDGGGRYWVEVDRLHSIYGPIVRISPWEVHIKDSEWNDVFKLSARPNKPWWYYRSFGSAQSTNTTEQDHIHRMHRGPLQSWFSAQNVMQNLPEVHGSIEKLHDRVAASVGQVINLSDAYRCLALDVVTAFAFRRPFGGLDHPEFNKDFNLAIKNYSRLGLINRYSFGIPFWLLQSLPLSIAARVSPKDLRVFMAIIKQYTEQSFGKPMLPEQDPQDVVQTMLAADLPEEQKSFQRVFGDCRSIVLAANETTATVLSSITYYTLSHPEIHDRLRNELKRGYEAKGSSLEYQELRALPYLTALINEALRTSNSVSGRLVRYADSVDLQYGKYSLPRGSYVSISMNDMHKDPKIFPNPEKFDPDRWLKQSDFKHLSKHLQPWGRGSRFCLGKELAYTDLYLTTARLFGPECGFSFKLFETKQSDWDIFGDYFAPMPARGSRSLRVVVEPPRSLQ